LVRVIGRFDKLKFKKSGFYCTFFKWNIFNFHWNWDIVIILTFIYRVKEFNCSLFHNKVIKCEFTIYMCSSESVVSVTVIMYLILMIGRESYSVSQSHLVLVLVQLPFLCCIMPAVVNR